MALTSEATVRFFFSPALSITDATSLEITSKITAVEDFILAVYGFSDSDTGNAGVPCLLLVASKLVQTNPAVAASYGSLQSEKLGDYTYTKKDTDASLLTGLYQKAATWEAMAISMLEARSFKDSKFGLYKVND